MSAPTDPTRPTLLVFSDDWGRHPSSCQHLVSQLMNRYAVVWVNTIGTRRPSIDLYSLHRAAGKLFSWMRPDSPADTREADRGPQPRVVDPLMWPSFRSRLGRRLNQSLLTRGVRRALGDGAPDPESSCYAITTLPIVADLVGRLPVERWLYYCVDDLAAWPGLDGVPLQNMEAELLQKVDAVISVSDSLQTRLSQLGRPSRVLTHGVDLEHWSSPVTAERPTELEALPRPWIVFWGVLDARLDTEVIREISEQLIEGSIVLLGPVNEPAPRVGGLRNVHAPGPLAYSRLPAVAEAMAVAVMPYRDLPATRAMQPLKLKEYLATGKPVVVSDLPAVAEWRDACDVATTPAEFARRVVERVRSGLPDDQRRARERLKQEGWSSKALELEAELLGEEVVP